MKSEPGRTRAKKSASDDAPKDVEVVAEDAGAAEDTDELDGEPDIEGEPGEEIDLDTEDLNLDDLEDEPADGDNDTGHDAEVEQPADTEASSKKVADAQPAEDEEIVEPSEKDKASGDFVWDEDESEALRQARKDADRKSTRLNSSHRSLSRMPSSA